MADWHWHHDLPPTTWGQANKICMDMIGQDESTRNPICAGKNLGKIENENWIKHLFRVCEGENLEQLVRWLKDGNIPGATRTDEPTGRVRLYLHDEDCPDGPMD